MASLSVMISGNSLSTSSPAELEPAESTAQNNRPFVETVLCRYQVGIPWRDPPERFSNFRVIHTRHMRRNKRSLSQRVFEVLAAEEDNEYAQIDRTIVRAHQHSAVAKKAIVAKKYQLLQRRSDNEDPYNLR